ncbi:hypothetical protein AALB39_16560 [Lachnospiraceae bacterium 54-53]
MNGYENITRLISATKSDFNKMTPMDLKTSILKSEGRVVMGQHLLFDSRGLVRGVTNTELLFAFGADMVLLNTYNFDDESQNPGMHGLTLEELKKRCNRPIGIYLGCPSKDAPTDHKLYDSGGMAATEAHIEQAIRMGTDFIVLGGNPGSGTSIQDVIDTTKRIKDKYGERVFLFSGKWEDGIREKVLGDPLAEREAREIVAELIDAGADAVDFPAPGSRNGISTDMIRELVQFTHSYKEGTLAMVFLNSSVEGSDMETIRMTALKMKETGADVHAIGDGGFSGCASPENIMQLSISLKGKPYTYFRMASTNI